MPIFRCTKCGCVENTATSNYWTAVGMHDQPPLCSECDPDIGKWHNRFEKRSADGMYELSDGYLYSGDEIMDDRLRHRMNVQGLTIVKRIGMEKDDDIQS